MEKSHLEYGTEKWPVHEDGTKHTRAQARARTPVPAHATCNSDEMNRYFIDH